MTWTSRVFGLLAVVAVVVEDLALAPAVERSQPPKLAIARGDGPPTIPDVQRDEVICFALYTTHAGVLKLSAQLYPLHEGESRDVTLQLRQDGQWNDVATQAVDQQHWMTTFRVEPWDDSRDVRYRLTHPGGATYEGRIRRNPLEEDEIVVAAFSCNSNGDRGPRADVVRNVQHQDPDLLFFAGDQSYDHAHHLPAWLLFGRQFGEIIKDTPTITIPDDHDVGQGNLWGAGGKKAQLKGGADGGYVMPVEYVNMVQRAQTSHLPDPVEPTPVARGITVYYTRLVLGGIDFAILEDRKWKSGPDGIVPQQGPRPDHVNDPDYDPTTIDLPELKLLGDRQLGYLRQWGQDWTGAEMKCVLSQTIFAGGAHIHGGERGRLLADLDSNGWPQSGRARALYEMRRAFAFHIAGDQHLATVIHHGVNQWEDSPWSFCTPAIENYYPRWWWPLEAPAPNSPPARGGAERGINSAEELKKQLPYTGRYYDGFHNKLTMHAYANPTKENRNGGGYGIVRFKKSDRTITIECWPRDVDATAGDSAQYPGWPLTIRQQDNYARRPMGYLPLLRIDGPADPVVQIWDEAAGEPAYTLRISGREFRPWVPRRGRYTIRVGDRDAVQEFDRVPSSDKPDDRVLDVSIDR